MLLAADEVAGQLAHDRTPTLQAHPTIIHHPLLDNQRDRIPLTHLLLVDPIILLITTRDRQFGAILRKGQARNLGWQVRVLLHAFFGSVIPDRDCAVGASRGKCVVAAAQTLATSYMRRRWRLTSDDTPTHLSDTRNRRR